MASSLGLRWAPRPSATVASVYQRQRQRVFSTSTTPCKATSKPPVIVVAMSGGVDSSVAAHLLRRSHPAAQLVGLHMSNWDASDEDGGGASGDTGGGDNPTARNDEHGSQRKRTGSSGTSSSSSGSAFCVQSEKEAADAQEVCRMLGDVPLHRASFAAEYWTGVFEPFVDGIERGRMPNPDGEFGWRLASMYLWMYPLWIVGIPTFAGLCGIGDPLMKYIFNIYNCASGFPI